MYSIYLCSSFKIFACHVISACSGFNSIHSYYTLLFCVRFLHKNDRHCRSSSHLGMSKISANNGGRVSFIQLTRNQSRCAECFVPNVRSSGSFINKLLNNWGSFAWFLSTCQIKHIKY